jgi:lysozyme
VPREPQTINPAPGRGRRLALAGAIATALAIPAEGLRQVAYYDPPGILTVCYGHTGADVVKGKRYTIEECKKHLDTDMQTAVAIVEGCIPGLPPNMLAAWSDAVYNIGPTIVCNTNKSTAARLLKAGQWVQACDQLPRWDKASVGGQMISLPGLTKRRHAERDLCLTPEKSEVVPGVIGHAEKSQVPIHLAAHRSLYHAAGAQAH